LGTHWPIEISVRDVRPQDETGEEIRGSGLELPHAIVDRPAAFHVGVKRGGLEEVTTRGHDYRLSMCEGQPNSTVCGNRGRMAIRRSGSSQHAIADIAQLNTCKVSHENC